MAHSTNDTNAVTSQAKNGTIAQASTLPPAGQVSSGVQAREGIQHPVSTAWHFFHSESAFPVRGRGIALYGLWNRAPLLSDDLPQSSSDVWERHSRLGLWYASHLVWRPAHQEDKQSWLTAAEVHDAWSSLRNRLDKLEEANRQRTARGTTPAGLAYRILHVQELKVHRPHLYQLRSLRSRKEIKQAEIDAQEAFVEELQRQFGLVEEDPDTGLAPSRFTHYDLTTQRKGWIVVSPQRALVAGVGAGEARTLASLIQPRDTDRTGKQGGIVPERYEDVLGRIGLWNGTQDVAETVSQLEGLVESGKKSIDGQVLLNFALAAIGVILALAPSLQLVNWQVGGGLGLIVVASCLFWLRARNGYALWLVLGSLLLVGVNPSEQTAHQVKDMVY